MWTKFTGIKDKIYKKGRYFFPLRAITPFFKLHLFKDKELITTNIISIELPLSEALKDLGVFNIKLKTELIINFKDNVLTGLTDTDHYKKEIVRIKENLTDATHSFLLSKIIQMITNGTDVFSEELLVKELNSFVTTFIQKRFEGLFDITSINQNIINMPDVETYRKYYNAAKTHLEDQTVSYMKKMIDLSYERRFKASENEIELDKLKAYLALIKSDKNTLPLLFLQKMTDKIKIILVPSKNQTIDFDTLLKQFKKQEVPGVNTQNSGTVPRTN
jgi:hypothetical protein